ncbi:ABC transporter permease [Devosia psychrophila]|uniref:ABC transporter permease n=1 Tax=Devosia psychrophila TaxID=728005 RepID=UPI00069B588A|nr:ABC transporter permease [Devosia psychrophila]
MTPQRNLVPNLLRLTPLAIFVVITVALTFASPRFLDVTNLLNIRVQSSYIAIIAIGMTFVLLIAGMDLSVGASMYVSAAIVGLYFSGLPVWLALPLSMLIGALFGSVNAVLVVVLRIPAFVATLATLFIGRGLALFISQTKMVFASDAILAFAQTAVLGVPLVIWTLAVLMAIALVVERMTPFGRYLFAIGSDQTGAIKAGLPVWRTIFTVYVVCGALAALGGFVSFSQTAVASSTFGLEKEFAVVAAVVLGGTSLFGGRGTVLGALFGAVLVQTVQNGLVLVNANPYIYPIVVSGIIFIAVLLDSVRTTIVARLSERRIRVEPKTTRRAIAQTGTLL